VSAEVAVSRRLLDIAERERLSSLIRQLGPLPSIADLSIDEMLTAMRRDKKVVDGKLHYVLSTAIGRHAIVDDVTEAELASALRVVGFKA
jgi:3-dehydroquinate synthase